MPCNASRCGGLQARAGRLGFLFAAACRPRGAPTAMAPWSSDSRCPRLLGLRVLAPRSRACRFAAGARSVARFPPRLLTGPALSVDAVVTSRWHAPPLSHRALYWLSCSAFGRATPAPTPGVCLVYVASVSVRLLGIVRPRAPLSFVAPVRVEPICAWPVAPRGGGDCVDLLALGRASRPH